MTTQSPEIAKSFVHGETATNYHDVGEGKPILLIHGSGPGVTAWANWRGIIPVLSKEARVIAPDMFGFGYSQCPLDKPLDLDQWVAQVTNLLDSLDIERVSVVGNSFGGAVALALAARHPERVERLVLMGAAGISFPLTWGLDKVWGYKPSLEAMDELLHIFAYDHSILGPDLARMRYEASTRDDVQARFAALFPEPHQAGIEMLAQTEDTLKSLEHKTLLIHGRDDRVVPLFTSQRMSELLPNAELHIFNRCGHWVQIEKAQEFTKLVSGFLL